MVEDVISELCSLMAMEMTGYQNSRGQVVALDHQLQGGCSSCNEHRVQAGSQRRLTYRELRRCFTEHSVPRSEIFGQPPRLLLNRYNKNKSRIDDQVVEGTGP